MLPKIDLPTYDLILPSNGKTVKVRPFVVKEEKLLLMAMESDEDDIDKTTLQVVNNCILDGTNVEELPFFDIDYIFIFLRAKSVGESIEVKFTCNNVLDEGQICNTTFPAKIDISKYEVLRDENIKPDVKLNQNTMIRMKYPTYAKIKKINNGELNEIEEKLELIVECIDMIVMGDDVYNKKDYTKTELIEFIEGLPQSHFRKLEEFVENFPSFLVVAEEKCPKCGFHHRIDYTDYTDFFE